MTREGSGAHASAPLTQTGEQGLREAGPSGDLDARGAQPDGLDPVASQALADDLPTLGASLDEVRVAGALERALLAGRLARYRVTACRRSQALVVPRERCLFRYEIEITDRLGGASRRHLVTTRLFGTLDAAQAHADQRLAPLAQRCEGRDDFEPLAAGAGVVPELTASFAVFPIDEDLPYLLGATDPARMPGVLSRALGNGRRGPGVESFGVARVYPGRGSRWVLRYEAEVAGRGGATEPVVVWGTVVPDEWDRRVGAAASALRKEIRRRTSTGRYAIPEFLGSVSELHLGVFGSVGGAPALDRLLRERVRGASADPWGLTLGGALEAGARLLALLHSCGVRSARRRRAADDLGALRLALERAGSASPALPERLGPALRRVEQRLASTSALRPGPAHGDFRPQRLLFERTRCALVGLDTFCSAEPARDLGMLIAQLGLSAAETWEDDDPAGIKALLDDLRNRALDAYLAARQSGVEPGALWSRTRAYEQLALLRVAVESWQELEADRLLAAVTLLEQT